METALELKGLCHRYGKFQSLDNLNLSLEAGKIYGLLGRNGAGKTTLLNVISGLLFPSQGQALVFGRACYEHPSVQKRLCVVREKAAYPRDLRVREALKLGKMLSQLGRGLCAVPAGNLRTEPAQKGAAAFPRHGFLARAGDRPGLARGTDDF